MTAGATVPSQNLGAVPVNDIKLRSCLCARDNCVLNKLHTVCTSHVMTAEIFTRKIVSNFATGIISALCWLFGVMKSQEIQSSYKENCG